MNRFTESYKEGSLVDSSHVIAKCCTFHKLEKLLKRLKLDMNGMTVVNFKIEDMSFEVPPCDRAMTVCSSVIDKWYILYAIEDHFGIKLIRKDEVSMTSAHIGKTFTIEFRVDKDENYPCAFKFKEKENDTWYVISPLMNCGGK